LTEEQITNKILDDKYDYNIDTTYQVYARDIRNGKIVGRGRMLDGDCPIIRNPILARYITSNKVREISRVVIDPDYRKTGLMAYIFGRLVKASVNTTGEVYFTSFDDGRTIYEGIGAEYLTEFTNTEFVNSRAHLFKMNLAIMAKNIGQNTPFVNKRLFGWDGKNVDED
jgi:GNAT superfamily N-acetyltransferase